MLTLTLRVVGSHLQLRRKWFRRMYGHAITWDTFILREYASVSDSDLSRSNFGDEIDHDETPVSPTADSTSSMCDSSGPATPLTEEHEEPAPQAAQGTAIHMDALATSLAGLDLYDAITSGARPVRTRDGRDKGASMLNPIGSARQWG